MLASFPALAPEPDWIYRRRARLSDGTLDREGFNLDAAIRLEACNETSLGRLFAAYDRMRLALADCDQATCGYAFADEVILDRVSTALRQLEVVGVGSQAIGVPADVDPGDLTVAHERRRDFVELRLGRIELGTVEGKQFLGGKRVPVEGWRRLCDTRPGRRRRRGDHRRLLNVDDRSRVRVDGIWVVRIVVGRVRVIVRIAIGIRIGIRTPPQRCTD